MRFHVSICDICGKVDGSIQIIDSYNCKRDLNEWSKEKRIIKQIEVKDGEGYPLWCNGHEESED